MAAHVQPPLQENDRAVYRARRARYHGRPVGSVAGKYLIDIVTGYDTARLPLLVFAAIGSTAVSIAFDCVVSRVLKKLEIDLNNNVRADVFDRILDADWQALHAFSCGDILNRFETDTGAVGGGAVSWLPQILVTAYRLCAVFFLIWIYSPVMALIALGGAPGGVAAVCRRAQKAAGI